MTREIHATPEEKISAAEQYALLTEENKEIVNRQIEKLIEMQSADRQ